MPKKRKVKYTRTSSPSVEVQEYASIRAACSDLGLQTQTVSKLYMIQRQKGERERYAVTKSEDFGFLVPVG